MREQTFLTEEEIQRLRESESQAPGQLHYWPTHYAGTTPYIIATDETGRETRLFVAQNAKGKTADTELSYSEADRAIAYAKRMTEAANLLPSLLKEREILAVLMDERLIELSLLGSGDWTVRIAHSNGNRYSVEWSTKREALLWAKRMFDQWDAALGVPLEEGKG